MAHKKGVGSSRNGRDSNPQYRGIKKFGGEKVIAGNIIVRQCGTRWHPGNNVGLGTDYTIYSLIDGVVKFEHKSKTRFKLRPRKPGRTAVCTASGAIRRPFCIRAPRARRHRAVLQQWHGETTDRCGS